MKYRCCKTEPTCEDCRYYVPYYLCNNGRFLPALVGECLFRPLQRTAADAPTCAKFLPPRESAPASSPEAAT